MPPDLHDTAWFRRPSGDDPGTTNLCYNAVDQHVIRGRADDLAFTGPAPLRMGQVLELVGTVAGAFRGLAVEEGSTVAIAHRSPRTRLVCVLAAARLGARAVVVGEPDDPGAGRPDLWVTDRLPRTWTHRPAAVLLDGPAPQDDARDVAWDMALRAGRTDPAGCASIAVTTTAYVVGREVSLVEALAGADESEIGIQVSSLVRARPVDV